MKFLEKKITSLCGYKERGADSTAFSCVAWNVDVLQLIMVIAESCHKDTGFSLPCHSTETKELKAQLQLLLAHFDIDYNLKDLKDPADEMELFYLVTEMCFLIFKNRRKEKIFKSMEECSIYDKPMFCVMEKKTCGNFGSWQKAAERPRLLPLGYSKHQQFCRVYTSCYCLGLYLCSPSSNLCLLYVFLKFFCPCVVHPSTAVFPLEVGCCTPSHRRAVSSSSVQWLTAGKYCFLSIPPTTRQDLETSVFCPVLKTDVWLWDNK